MLLIQFFASPVVHAEHIRLEKSTLTEFVQVVSDYLDKPVMVTADLKQPFFFSGDFKTKEDLKNLIRSAVLSYGLDYDETTERILISSKLASAVPQLPPSSDIPPVTKPDIKQVDVKPLELPYLVSYPLQHLSTDSVYPVLSKMVKVSVFESVVNNTLLVTATTKEHAEIKRYLKVLDSPVKQVLIEAVISELSDKDYQGLDSKLDNYRGLDTAINDLAPYAVVNPFTSLASFGMKLLSSKSLRFFLDWVQTSDSSSVLSKPKIVTLDRKPASIMVGQNVPFITGKATGQASSTATPFQTIERHDIGLKLQVTPVILPSGIVELSILQESSSVSTDTTASDVVTNKRSVTSTALIRDGDTLLLGGLSSNATSGGHTATIPDGIPFLSWFFSGDVKNQSNTNLVVLITAKIIHVSGLPATSAAHSQRRAAEGAGE